MSEAADEVIAGMRGLVQNNTSEEGVDVVNVYSEMIEVLRADPAMTIDLWELTKMTINHGALIACNLIDQEIVLLKDENHG